MQDVPTRAPVRGTGRRLGVAIVAVAVLAVAVALVVGVSGLLGNPVHDTGRAGVVRLEGTFDPFTAAGSAAACARCSEGYVRDGGRSVFVVFPASCGALGAGARVDVTATADPSLGSASYRATGCNGTSAVSP